MIKTIHLGAHNIGRGVIGQLLSDAVIAVTFVHYSGPAADSKTLKQAEQAWQGLNNHAIKSRCFTTLI